MAQSFLKRASKKLGEAEEHLKSVLPTARRAFRLAGVHRALRKSYVPIAESGVSRKEGFYKTAKWPAKWQVRYESVEPDRRLSSR